MKLASLLIAELIAAGKMDEACSALLEHFGCQTAISKNNIRVNTVADRTGAHILVYTGANWYEWGSDSGFRCGRFHNRTSGDRVVVWRPATNKNNFL